MVLLHRNGSGHSMAQAILLGFVLTAAIAWPAASADRRWIGDAFNDTWSEDDNWSPSGPPQDGNDFTLTVLPRLR